MIINLVDRCGGSGDVADEFRGAQWERLGRLAAGLGEASWSVDVVLVGDAPMAELNQRYRTVDGVTDVLSFSYLESGGAGRPDLARGEGQAASDLWCAPEPAGGGTVGELVLAPAFIARRCAENDWPLAAEIPLLLVHGCLHLLGWDHEEPAARAAMQDVEMTVLAGEGLAHPLLKRS